MYKIASEFFFFFFFSFFVINKSSENKNNRPLAHLRLHNYTFYKSYYPLRKAKGSTFMQSSYENNI